MKALHRYLLLFSAVLLAAVVLSSGRAYAGTYNNEYEFNYNSSTQEVEITKYIGSGTSTTVPAQINGYYVTAIEYSAFKNASNLTTVTFASGSRLRDLESYAFENCKSLKTISLPNTVRKMEGGCFMGCSSLTSVVIPEGVTALGDSTSYGVFEGCTALSSVKLPSTLVRLGQHTFRNCTSLKQIAIPASLTTVNAGPFSGSGITSITLPDSLTYVSYHMFEDCTALKSVTLSANVTDIDSGAFSGCTALESINIPVDLKTLDANCFKGCTALKTLRFGDAVDYVGSDAFMNCPNLTVYVVRGTKVEEFCMNNDVKSIAYASSMGGCRIEGIVDKTYTGSPLTQQPKVTLGTDTLSLNTDYTITYSNNTETGTATMLFTGIGNYVGKVTQTFRIAAEDINKCTVKLSDSSMVYQAKYLKPSVQVSFQGKTVSTGDYRVSYSQNQYVGTATVTVRGIENFKNSKKVNFTIVPKGTSLKKLSKKSKGFKATWKLNKIQTSGYELQYSRKKNFSGAKKSKIKNTYTKTKTIKKLKAKKTYYVRIRCFKKVGSKNYYSAWSKAKKIKTAK